MRTAPKKVSRSPRRSLRTILIVWFLLFSIVPLAFVTGYSIVKYEQAIDNELVERLRANVREFNTTIAEYEKYFNMRMQRHEGDATLITNLSINNTGEVRSLMRASIRNSLISTLSVFSREGRMIARLTQDEVADAKEFASIESQDLYLQEPYKQRLDTSGRIAAVNPGSGNSMDLVVMTRLNTSTGRCAGYIEEIYNIDGNTLQNLKRRLGIEIMLFDRSGNLVAASHDDLLLYNKHKKDFFAKAVLGADEVFFDLNIQTAPYNFITSPVKWGDGRFLIGLGASKEKSKAILRNVNYAFFTVTGAIFVLVIVMAFLSARVLLRPLNDLLLAIQRMDQTGQAVPIPVQSDNEIGVLTESFNDMARSMRQARLELEKKIKETEQAYSELKDAQAKLVHSAKMASLGQLVAGVAHELNNPIGFIFSNMSHLRDYSDRLLKLIETAETNPKQIAKAKEEIDYEYIVQDLPRLIQSCEDGARRVRDIVLGLRNFSRLEEAKIKKVNLAEGVQETLRLLSGELKGRIKVHTEFGPMPDVLCYASQLNQVFMNILSNAAQAIEAEGEIWVTTKHLKPKRGETGQGRAHISIRDSGKGMSPDIVEKIFDPFFTTKTIGQGTGLGLSISYGIVKKHGGDIVVKSEAGKGTEFIISLPVDGPPGAEKEAQTG